MTEDASGGFGEGEGREGENDGKLGDDAAGRAEGINNRPGGTEPGELGVEETAGEGDEGEGTFGSLSEEVAAGSVADKKLYQDEDDGVNRSGGDERSGRAEEGGKEGLDERIGILCLRFDENQPDGVEGGEEDVDGEDFGAGKVGEDDEGSADDEVNEAGF